VAGLRRDQIVMLDLAASPVTVTSWATTRYQQQCAAVFATYMRDVDVSPDGSYFVVVTTGAYRAGSLCDAAARWETAATGPGQQPTWVDYTGGDSLYSVAVTGTAVHVGGHQRWMNDSFAGDRPALARSPARASPPSTRSTACPCPGTRGATAAWACSPWSPPPRPLDRQRHRTHRPLRAPRPHRLHASCRRHRGARAPRRHPGRLYTGHADGTMTVRSFDGTTAGPATPLALNGLTSTRFPVSRITGMFLWNGRLYYTLSADPRLYSRWFTPQSGTIGADTFVASGAGDGRNWSTVTGMTHGLRPPDLRHQHRHRVHRRLLGRPPRRPGHRAQRPGRRRPLLAVPRPVRPQPGRLTGPRVRYPALHHAPVAQGTEQLSPKQQVAGSSPARGTRKHILAAHPHTTVLEHGLEQVAQPCSARSADNLRL
jgi:hypothetical protein